MSRRQEGEEKRIRRGREDRKWKGEGEWERRIRSAKERERKLVNK